MSTIPSIVEGEASESDNEDVVNEHKGKKAKKNYTDIHGIIVAGEASESEDEKNNAPKEDLEQDFAISNCAKSNSAMKEEPGLTDSLLQKKLSGLKLQQAILTVECNLSLRNNIINLVKTTVQNSLEQLTDTEKLLVNSQMRAQRASGSIKTFSNNSNLIINKLALSSSYLPQIHIPDEVTLLD